MGSNNFEFIKHFLLKATSCRPVASSENPEEHLVIKAIHPIRLDNAMQEFIILEEKKVKKLKF
jgi:hypothetical protein